MRRAFLLSGLLTLLPRPGRAQALVPAPAPAPAITPALEGTVAHLLAGLITTTREQVIADGVHPLPNPIYRGLIGFFPDALLRRVRFAGGLREGIVLPSLAFRFGDAAAMTLGDVIVFREPAQSAQRLKLWAHELTHVLQYQRWGIEGFADRFVRDSKAVEAEAYANADRFVAWHAGRS